MSPLRKADHVARATAARQTPGEAVRVHVYPSRDSALGITSLIRSASITAYAPAGSFETYVETVEDGTAVMARYLGAANLIPPRPKPTAALVPVPGGMFTEALNLLIRLLTDDAPLSATTAASLLDEAGHDVAAEVVRAYAHGTSTKARMHARTAALYLIERDTQRAARAAVASAEEAPSCN